WRGLRDRVPVRRARLGVVQDDHHVLLGGRRVGAAGRQGKREQERLAAGLRRRPDHVVPGLTEREHRRRGDLESPRRQQVQVGPADRYEGVRDRDDETRRAEFLPAVLGALVVSSKRLEEGDLLRRVVGGRVSVTGEQRDVPEVDRGDEGGRDPRDGGTRTRERG